MFIQKFQKRPPVGNMPDLDELELYACRYIISKRNRVVALEIDNDYYGFNESECRRLFREIAGKVHEKVYVRPKTGARRGRPPLMSSDSDHDSDGNVIEQASDSEGN